jgi:hypothetical protein
MSISSIQSSIQRAQSDISDLHRKLSDASGKEADKSQRIAQIHSGITSTTSASTMQSKLREIARLQDDISRVQKDKADLNKRIADKTKDLHRYQTDLMKEEERERKKVQDADRRRQHEQADYQRELSRQLDAHRQEIQAIRQVPQIAEAEALLQYDLFISHASEDKDDFVRPLAEALKLLGVRVWYDEFQLLVGDSLRRSIDKGLVNSKYGVVVLSSSFFAKNWPQYELDGMVAREMNGVKVVLPIWHKVTKNEVMAYSPSLADKVALNSSLHSIEEIAKQLANVVRV